MLAMEWPTSTTNAEPFPAANLEEDRLKSRNRDLISVRIQDTCVGNVEGRNLEILEHDLSHPFSIGRGVPRGFGYENRMLRRVDAHDIDEGV